MTPKCCQECPQQTSEVCKKYQVCMRWRAWYYKTWRGLQTAARYIKEKTKENNEK